MSCTVVAPMLVACNGAVDTEAAAPGSQGEPVVQAQQALSDPSVGCSAVTATALAAITADIDAAHALVLQDLAICTDPTYTLCQRPDVLTRALDYLDWARADVQSAVDGVGNPTTQNGGIYVYSWFYQYITSYLGAAGYLELWSAVGNQTPNARAAFEDTMQASDLSVSLMAEAGRCWMLTP
jgi:hypothetical protein